MFDEERSLQVIQRKAPFVYRLGAGLVDLFVAYVIFWVFRKIFFVSAAMAVMALFIMIRDVIAGQGQSIGKKLFDLRVIFLDENLPADASTSIFRNIILGGTLFLSSVLYLLTGFYGLGFVFSIFLWLSYLLSVGGIIWEIKCYLASGKGQRFGDLLAHTLVIRLSEK